MSETPSANGIWQIAEWLWGLMVPAFWYIMNRVNKLYGRLGDHKTHVAEKYVAKNDFSKQFDRFDRKLDRIFDLLEKKADK